MWQLKTAVFLNWCLIHSVLLANPLAYYDTETISTVKSLIVQAAAAELKSHIITIVEIIKSDTLRSIYTSDFAECNFVLQKHAINA
jgi:hypothetical protein